MFSRSIIQQTLSALNSARGTAVITAFTGSTAASAIAVLDQDNRPSVVRGATANQLAGLIAGGVDAIGEVYRVTVVRSVAPDPNAKWWVSLDGGTTKAPVDYLKHEVKNNGAFYVVYLQKV